MVAKDLHFKEHTYVNKISGGQLNKILITFLLCLTIVGCGDNLSSGDQLPPIPPPDKEWDAQNKFQTSELAKEFHSNGVSLDCEDVCSQITEAEINLLRAYKNNFFAVKNKIGRITLGRRSQTSFSHPVGDYGVYFPVNLSLNQLKDFFENMQWVLKLEEKSGFKVFISSVSTEVESALKTLVDNGELLKTLPKSKIYISDGPTQYSKSSRFIEFDYRLINSSFKAAFDQIDLFLKFYSVFPNIDFFLFDDSEVSRDFMKKLIQNASAINSILQSRPLNLSVSNLNLDELYFAGRNYFGSTLISLSSDISIQLFLDILSYEVAVTDLSKYIGLAIRYHENFVRYDNFKDCQSKLELIKPALFEKRKNIEYINFNFSDEQKRSSFTNGFLLLSCPTETVEEMLNIIDSIGAK